MSRGGILIHEDGSIEVCRALPGSGSIQVEYFARDLNEYSLKSAMEAWASGDDDCGLPALSPDDAPIYKVVQQAVPLTAPEAQAYLAQLEENRADYDGECAAEADSQESR